MSDVEFFGETFGLKHPDEYEWAMVEFAEISEATDVNSVEALAAVMSMLRAAIVDDDFPRFKQAARKNKAQVQRDLMPVIVAAFHQPVPERPTGRSSDSSGGPASTDRKSESEPVSEPLRLIRKFEAEGRPDKAQFVRLAQASAS